MSPRRHIALTVGLFLGILLIGGVFILWPSYREIIFVCTEVENLNNKVEFLSDRNKLVMKLTAQVEDQQAYVEQELKFIPETSDMAGLMRHLSLPVDGVIVIDQTITAGSPKPAVIGEEPGAQVVPLTIDMEATFDSVFSLVKAAESMRRLVRVTTVRLQSERQPGADRPIITASVGLDAVFQPVTLVEGH